VEVDEAQGRPAMETTPGIAEADMMPPTLVPQEETVSATPTARPQPATPRSKIPDSPPQPRQTVEPISAIEEEFPVEVDEAQGRIAAEAVSDIVEADMMPPPLAPQEEIVSKTPLERAKPATPESARPDSSLTPPIETETEIIQRERKTKREENKEKTQIINLQRKQPAIEPLDMAVEVSTSPKGDLSGSPPLNPSWDGVLGFYKK